MEFIKLNNDFTAVKVLIIVNC